MDPVEKDRLVKQYVHHKRMVVLWESAIVKALGRPPNRDDLKKAPKDIQDSYSRYREIKQYLEQCMKAVKDGTPGKPVLVPRTPRRIFVEKKVHMVTSPVGPAQGLSKYFGKQVEPRTKLPDTATWESKKALPAPEEAKPMKKAARAPKAPAGKSELKDSLENGVKSIEKEKTENGTSGEAPEDSGSDSDTDIYKIHNLWSMKLFAAASELKPTATGRNRYSLGAKSVPFVLPHPIPHSESNKRLSTEAEPKTSPSTYLSNGVVVSSPIPTIPTPDPEPTEVHNELDLTFATGRLKKNLRSSISSVEATKNREGLSVDSLMSPSTRKSIGLRNIDKGWLSRCRNESGSEAEEEPEKSEPLPVPRTRAQLKEAEAKSARVEEMETSEESNIEIPAVNAEVMPPPVPLDFMSSIDALASISDLDQLPSVLLDSAMMDFSMQDEQEELNPEILVGEDEIRDILKEITSLSRTPLKKAILDSDPYRFGMNTTLESMDDVQVSPEKPKQPESLKKKRCPSPADSPPKGPKRKFFKTSRSDVILKKAYSVSSYKPPTPVKRRKQALAAPPKKTLKTKITGNPNGSRKINGASSVKINSSTLNGIEPKVSRVTRSGISHSKSATSLAAPVIQIPGMEIDGNCPSPISTPGRVTRSSSSTPAKTQPLRPLKSKSKVKAKVNVEESQGQTKAASKKGPTRQEADTFDEVMRFDQDTSVKAKGKGKGRRPKMTSKAVLQRKVANGTLNDNYVRVDVNKKVFVRGRKRITGTQVKRNDWKLRKAAASNEAKIKLTKCHKCGEVGHFSKFCIKDFSAKEDEPDKTDDSPFPSLEEAARMVWSKHNSHKIGKRTFVYECKKTPLSETGNVSDSQNQEPFEATKAEPEPVQSVDSVKPFNLADSECLDTTIAPNNLSVEPVFLIRDGETGYNLADETAELRNALKLFGHNDFRPGQQEAITRVLRGQSTLVILSTGSGKSLCYFLPAYLYAKHNPGVITLCISPLVSLMEDQVQSIPSFLYGACLHTNMTEKQRGIVLEKVRDKKLNVLLVSPEAVCGGLFGLLRNSHEFPPIAFACIDEVHCVSEWSHNFRPSYLKLCKILRDKLNVRTILGLTATATNHTCASICEHLQVDPSTVIRGELVPRNLRLSVSCDIDRQNALMDLLNGERFKDCNSIIIYCTRREECERISSFIRTNMQESGFSGVKRSNSRQSVSTSCEAYHAGMSAARRRRVQNFFMTGTIRIVVATVAFGMGIDKSDIRAVIHYNMPKTFESYVQEIGRAGRDGLPAECHLFMDHAKGKDLCELKRHVYSNSVERATVRNLLSKIFKPCKCERIDQIKGRVSRSDVKAAKERKCGGHEVSFSVEDTVRDLDLPEENIETLLCYLELDTSRKWIEMMPKCYQVCRIQSYGGTKLLKAAAITCPPLAVAIALEKERKKFKEGDLHIQFNMVEVAATVGWNSAVVRSALKRLEWTGTEFDAQGNATKFRKSGLLVEFTDLAYRLIAPGQLTEEESDTALNFLFGRNFEQEKTQLYQLQRVYEAFESVSLPRVNMVIKTFDEEKSDRLKRVIYEYFNESATVCPSTWQMEFPASDLEKEDDIRLAVQKFLLSHGSPGITGRNIAKIFQGISSPCFPSTDWSRNRSFWRRHLDVDFHFLCKIAADEVIGHQYE